MTDKPKGESGIVVTVLDHASDIPDDTDIIVVAGGASAADLLLALSTSDVLMLDERALKPSTCEGLPEINLLTEINKSEALINEHSGARARRLFDTQPRSMRKTDRR